MDARQKQTIEDALIQWMKSRQTTTREDAELFVQAAIAGIAKIYSQGDFSKQPVTLKSAM